jgi:hypothetical protein
MDDISCLGSMVVLLFVFCPASTTPLKQSKANIANTISFLVTVFVLPYEFEEPSFSTPKARLSQ